MSSIWVIFWAGLLLRLLLMPFFAHSDLLTGYWSAHLWTDHQRFEDIGLEVPIRSLHAAFLWALGPALPQSETIWPAELDEKPLDALSSTEDWRLIISDGQMYRVLFLFKLPYLAFDLGCLIVLGFLVQPAKARRLVIAAWWLNPVLIFGTYVFARHDVITQFFILLSLLQLSRDKAIWALGWLGIAISLRYYPALLLPLYVLSVRLRRKQWILLILLGLAPFLLAELYGRISGGFSTFRWLIALPHNSYLLSARLPIAMWDNLYLFPLFYFLLVIHRIYQPDRSWDSLVSYSMLCMLLLFAFAATGQSPHYWVWLVPFVVLGASADPHLLPLHYAQCILLLLYSFVGGRSTAGYLLGAVSPDFFWSLPGPGEIVGQYISMELFVSLAHTALTAVTLYMAYAVFQKIKINVSVTDPTV